MASVAIGAVHVDLGLNSAQFAAGMKQAQTGLNKFGIQITLGLETIAEGIGKVIGAIPSAIKGAVDHADALSKAAQKAGTTTEALSRLAYAASFSDVSLEGLTSGLGKLSKSMADAVQSKTSTAAIAFKALGISVTDSAGRLRKADDVFADISDKFARLPDGATKTSLAMMLLGKSGAEMIPLLNGGSEELRRMAAEADRLGITISTKTGHDAERFNDTLTLVGKVLEGVVNTMMEAALPALQSFAQQLASPRFAEAAQTLAKGVITALAAISDVVVGLVKAFGDLGTAITNAFKTAAQSTSGKSLDQLKKQLDDEESGLQVQLRLAGGNNEANGVQRSLNMIAALKKQIAVMSSVSGMGLGAAGGATSLVPGKPSSPLTPPVLPNQQAEAAAEQAAKAYNKIVASAKDRIAQSQIEAQALGKTAEEADRLRFSQELLADATKDGAKLSTDQVVQLNGLADAMAQAADRTRQLTEIYDVGKGVFEGFFSDLKSNLQDSADLWAAMGNAASKALNSIADKALSMAADGLWDIIFGAITGGGVIKSGASLAGGALGGGAIHLGSFDGGGYTGAGTRSGGLDGMGGFLAMLHPDETVIDHTRGQSTGPQINISITGSRQDAAEIARQVGRTLPDAIAAYNRNPRRRT